MRKNKKYRYTAEEQAIHEEAMRLRKMTDRQLVEQFHRAADIDIALRVPQIVHDCSNKTDSSNNTSDIKKLISALSEGKCKGIKGGTVYKITEFATEMGLI